MNPLLRYRRPLVVLLHLGLIALSNYLAFWIRFDGTIPPQTLAVFWQLLPVVVLVRSLFFAPFRLYEGLWRYTSIWDLRNILIAVFSSTVTLYLLIRWGLGFASYPRSVYLIDSLLLLFFVSGIRLLRRVYRDLSRLERGKRILIYGAGDAGELIARDMKNNPFYEYEPVGFIDDDPRKIGRRIHGIKVLGTRGELPRLVAEKRADAVLVAMPRAKSEVIRSAVKILEQLKVPLKILPNLRDVLDGRVSVSEIRNVSIADLLERAPVGLDIAPVRELIAGRRVLVTGAGGSIGSELCRQIAALDPGVLLLFDRYENGLHEVRNDLDQRGPRAAVHCLVGDVLDTARVEAAMAEYRPEIVFHAAAHKHVPLMELNPCEAVKNNVTATRMLAVAARRHEVERFILISSDKAVNPSSVMGATKRAAEMLVQGMVDGASTAFIAVRFGNVLGSNGSVIPRFMQQIEAGGPVTVTHPHVRRYFMLIPEAVQLVLHAAALGESGAVYMLDMGEPVKIVDLARNLIRLSGFVPDAEIAIKFTGLRPGEKLFEELAASDESMEASAVAGIFRVRGSSVPRSTTFARMLAELEELAFQGDDKAVRTMLREVVPTFRPTAPF
jgi:FlaA1/EpsC-like NDP-sugar epimerase